MTKRLLKIAGRRFTPRQIKRLECAIDFATHAHQNAKRASGEPFITHPVAVAEVLLEWNMDIDSIITGILHDTIEDTDATQDDIRQNFGEVVAFLTSGVTKLGQVRKNMEEIDTYLPATKDNLTKLLLALGQDIRVIIIKLADRLHNLRTLSSLPKQRQIKIAKESIEVFAPIADRLNMGRVRVEIEEISFSYLEPERFQYLKTLIADRVRHASESFDIIKNDIAKTLKSEKIDYQIDNRLKSIYSLHKKMNKHDQNVDEIYDLMALRIIVNDKTDCYLVLGLLHSLYKPMIERIKDYISVPKQNGYQSLHTTVITPYGQIVEFQVRTKEMHEYAEKGLAAAFHYNEQKLTDAYAEGKIASLPANLHWIRDLQKAAAALTTDVEPNLEDLKMDLFKDRIFAYTPKGDIYDLPEGSVALDFAYRVHSDIGNRAYTAKINGRTAKLNQPLKTGDVVEIITRKTAKPSENWLKVVKTAQARNKIRQALSSKTNPK